MSGLQSFNSPPAIFIRKIYYYEKNGLSDYTTLEHHAYLADFCRLATLEELEQDAPLYKDFICEINEGYFVFWEKIYSCILTDLDEEESYEYGYKQLFLT
ncbi:hypothetical protein [Paenibacillus sp. RC84]|uniref:hypothetical protein n=1 Tax=Paenibacillus sp. RC84 TaxID=3156252 RepID=UPI0035120D5F